MYYQIHQIRLCADEQYLPVITVLSFHFILCLWRHPCTHLKKILNSTASLDLVWPILRYSDPDVADTSRNLERPLWLCHLRQISISRVGVGLNLDCLRVERVDVRLVH